MTPTESISNGYDPSIKSRSLYPTFHAAARDLSDATNVPYSEAVGLVFGSLAEIAGCKVHSPYLGTKLQAMHESGELAARLASHEGVAKAK